MFSSAEIRIRIEIEFMVSWCASLRLYLQLERSRSIDENLTETTKVLAIRNMLKLFHSLISLVGCIRKGLGPQTI